MTKKVIKKNNNILIPIPKKMGKHFGLGPGSHVKVTDDGYRIIITPEQSKEEEFTEEELDKIEALAKEKGGKSFKSGRDFMKYLDKISKK